MLISYLSRDVSFIWFSLLFFLAKCKSDSSRLMKRAHYRLYTVKYTIVIGECGICAYGLTNRTGMCTGRGSFILDRSHDITHAVQNRNIEIGNRWFEYVAQYRYLRTPTTNQDLIQKRRLNSGNACYHSVQNLSFSRLLSKNIKITIHKIYHFACGSMWVWNLVSWH
jgi:hypothetical protein